MLIDQFVERSQQHWKLRLSIGEDDATANSTADDSSISSNDVSLHNGKLNYNCSFVTSAFRLNSHF